ncbi:MAG: fused MFS/spermidine synthase [Acidobacteria bacterium]|nr:fused MFS/spermidine synthase [Acidobacteriota bacterium]
MKRSLKNSKTLCRIRGLAHDLAVTRKGDLITLWSASGIRHTVLNSAAPHLPGLEYARNVLAALAFCPQAQSCLVLGLGGGSIPRMLLKARPQIQVEAVEIDPAIVELADKYFDIHALPRFKVRLEDAAEFIGRCNSQYGVVIVDTYIGEQFPDQCATQEFIGNARKCMVDDGVLVLNWLSGNRQNRMDLLKMIEWTVGPVWQLPGLKSGNVLYFASAGDISLSAILSAAKDIQPGIPFKNSLGQLVQRLKMVSG